MQALIRKVAANCASVGTHVIPQGFDQVIPQVLAVFLF